MNCRNAQKFELHFHQKFYVFLSSLHHTADVSEKCQFKILTANIVNIRNIFNFLKFKL